MPVIRPSTFMLVKNMVKVYQWTIWSIRIMNGQEMWRIFTMSLQKISLEMLLKTKVWMIPKHERNQVDNLPKISLEHQVRYRNLKMLKSSHFSRKWSKFFKHIDRLKTHSIFKTEIKSSIDCLNLQNKKSSNCAAHQIKKKPNLSTWWILFQIWWIHFTNNMPLEYHLREFSWWLSCCIFHSGSTIDNIQNILWLKLTISKISWNQGNSEEMFILGQYLLC